MATNCLKIWQREHDDRRICYLIHFSLFFNRSYFIRWTIVAVNRVLRSRVGFSDELDNSSSVYPMSCQLHDIGCTEDHLSIHQKIQRWMTLNAVQNCTHWHARLHVAVTLRSGRNLRPEEPFLAWDMKGRGLVRVRRALTHRSGQTWRPRPRPPRPPPPSNRWVVLYLALHPVCFGFETGFRQGGLVTLLSQTVM